MNFKTLVVLRDFLSFGNPVAGLILYIICYFYVDLEIGEEKVKELIASFKN